MRYCVYRQWSGSQLQEILEYFDSWEQAMRYALSIKPKKAYTVHVGEFVNTWS